MNRVRTWDNSHEIFLNFDHNHNHRFLNSNQSSHFFSSAFFQMRLSEWNMHIFSLCLCVVHLFPFFGVILKQPLGGILTLLTSIKEQFGRIRPPAET